MKKLSNEAYLTLREDATVIEADSHGDKVLLLRDGTYLKLFRVKRLITSAHFSPYSKRFAENADKLRLLGIPTISVIQTYRIPSIQRTAVHYSPLTGNTLRNLPNGIDEALAEKLGKFIRELHDKGIYFRSLHLGNVVLTPNNELGLIDIADMSFYNHPLSASLRLRNFHHLCRYNEDRNAISKNLTQFNKGLDDPQLTKNIRPLLERASSADPFLDQASTNKTCKKETVIQIRPTTTTAGLMDSTNQFMRSFDRNHYHLVVIYLKGSLPENQRKRVVADKVLCMNLSNSAMNGLKLFATYKLYKIIKQYQPSILLAHRYHSIWLAGLACLFCRIKMNFAVLHGNNQIHHPGRRFFIKHFLKNQFYFIGISNIVRQDILTSNAGLSPDQVFAIPDSLDIENQQKYLLPKDTAQKKLLIPNDKFIIGHVARLSEVKNQDLLLKAFALAQKTQPNLFLVIIGYGHLEKKLKALALQLGINHSVLFTGAVDRAADYMKAFDLFAMTSNDEGFGRVLIEAMAARIPIVATDIPAFVEVLGGSGSLVRPNDVVALSNEFLRHASISPEKIEEIIADQDFVLFEKFCQEKFKQRFQKLYTRLLDDQ
ncbi:MAG: glycosyltransferase [Pseudomonadales bacterium]|nr:glycosyltransferase [Pseudomonadales bacterium]